MEKSRGTTEVWQHEKIGEAIDKGKAPAAVEAPGMKVSQERAQTWHHVTGSEPLKRGQGALGKGAACGDSSIWQMPELWDNQQRQMRQRSRDFVFD